MNCRHFIACLSGRFPEAHLLSHDLLEGSHVRVGLATDIELLDVFPSSYIAWWNRQHRWIRGDWQIIDWLKPRVPVGGGRVNPTRFPRSTGGRSLTICAAASCRPRPSRCSSTGWLFTPAPMLWSGIVAGLSALASLQFAARASVPSAAAWDEILARAAGPPAALDFRGYFSRIMPRMALGAIARVAYRRLISHRLLLEWETAQDAHRRAKNSAAAVHSRAALDSQRMRASSRRRIVAGNSAVVAVAPFLLLWALFPAAVIADQSPGEQLARRNFNRQPIGGCCAAPHGEPGDILMISSGRKPHWLPPDNFQETPIREIFLRTSPTNIGLWMLATVAANDFGYITLDDVVARNLGTLETSGQLERFEGHLSIGTT